MKERPYYCTANSIDPSRRGRQPDAPCSLSGCKCVDDKNHSLGYVYKLITKYGHFVTYQNLYHAQRVVAMHNTTHPDDNARVYNSLLDEWLED